MGHVLLGRAGIASLGSPQLAPRLEGAARCSGLLIFTLASTVATMQRSGEWFGL